MSFQRNFADYIHRVALQSDTPSKASGSMSRTISKAVGAMFRILKPLLAIDTCQVNHEDA